MEPKKKWWASKTIWASLVVIATGIFGASRVIPEGMNEAELVESIVAGVTLVAGLFALYGRKTASSTIG